jgi:nitronate monooxygenase
MQTPLCELLGMTHPVFQASIGGISCPALAAAVSNAGGLGVIALTGWGVECPAQQTLVIGAAKVRFPP